MKPQELRIGNIIIKDNEEIIVSPYDMINLELGLNDYKPIFLTEEWLEKFRLNKTGEDDFDKTFGDIKQISIRKNKLHNTDKFGVYLNRSRIVNIKYVHQLQNLYHAITGKEIEF